MPNYRQAPKLYHNKNKYKSNNYYNLPQELMDSIFQQLDGKSGNQIKLMVVLLGTLGDGSFRVSEKWITDRCGMIQQTYSKARQALVERGWIYLEDGNIYVIPHIIKNGFPPFPKDATPEDLEKYKSNTILSHIKEIKEQYGIKSETQCEDVPITHPLKKEKQFEIVPTTQFEIVPQAQYEDVYNIIKINNSEQNNKVELVIPDGLTNSTTNDYQIEKEITHQVADAIIDKQWVGADIIYVPASGKYFKVR